MNVMAEMGGWLHLPLNPFRMQKLTENYVVSNAKIKRLWGYKRCRYPQKRDWLVLFLALRSDKI